MVQSFDSFEGMMAAMRDAQQEADSRVQDFQKALGPGMFYLSVDDDLNFIYGQVLDPAKRADGRPFESEEEAQDYMEQAECYGRPHMQHYRFVRASSQACPEGELGDMHVSTVAAVLDPQTFEAAKAAGWPGARELLTKDVGSQRELLHLRHEILAHIERQTIGDQ